MRKMNHFKLLAVICAMALFASCNFEEINTNQFEMSDGEGAMDGFEVGGLITAMQRTVIPVGTQADDTDVINEYQIAYHLSADNWSGFFGENNSNGWNAGSNNTTYYLLDNWIKATYTQSYTNALDPWKKLKIASEKNGTPEVFALAQILKISAWHKTLESFGPMPYSHAADATMNIPFDSEKEVYTAMFEELTAAIEELTEKAENGVNVMGAYDAVYAGDATKWVKYGNSLMLRLAMRVRFADAELAKKYATQAVNHSIGVMTAKDDAAQMSQGAGGRVILKEGGSIHDIYANTFLKKDHLGYVEVKSDGTFGMEKGEPVYLGKTSPDFNMGWSNMLTYKGFGLGFQINGRFGGVVTSSTEALLDRFGVSKRSAEAREAGGVLLKGQGLVDAKSYYQMTGTGNYETSGYYVYSATNIRLQELTFSYTMPNKWFGNVLKDVTVSFIANNPWMLYCEAPFDPELTPSTSTYGQGNDYFMQPSVRSFGFGIKFKL